MGACGHYPSLIKVFIVTRVVRIIWVSYHFYALIGGFMLSIEGLKRRFIKDINGSRYTAESPVYDYSQFVPLEVKAGSLVLLHGNLVHQRYSFWEKLQNTSECFITYRNVA